MNSVINPFIYLTHAQKVISQKMNKMVHFFLPKKEEKMEEENFSSAVTKDTSVATVNGNEAA